jgi:hypothetical protein
MVDETGHLVSVMLKRAAKHISKGILAEIKGNKDRGIIQIL